MNENYSHKMMIGYFANTKSVFAEFLRVLGMSKGSTDNSGC